jgi:hypothetical protein
VAAELYIHPEDAASTKSLQSGMLGSNSEKQGRFCDVWAAIL